MNNEVMFSSDKNYWETPQALFDSLDEEFHFTLDAAASDGNHKCDRYFTEQDDGLKQDWGGRQYSAIRLTEIRKLGSGRESVGRNLKSQILQSLC